MLEFTPQFGRLENPDERDSLFPVSAILPEPDPFVTEKYWWDGGWWGNQGSTFQCVAYSLMHWVEDGPVVQDAIVTESPRPKPLFNPAEFYNACQERDPWEGKNYNGTSVRTGVKLLHELGVIKEYRWATSSHEIAQALLYLGPVVVGTRWYSDMSNPRSDGLMRPTGHSMGGHAYLLNGVDLNKKLFRVKNSWGFEWGRNGYGYISFESFDKLLAEGGEAVLPVENKLVTLPSLANLSPPTSA